MKKSLRSLMVFLTAVLAVLIGLSDYFGWSDSFCGRKAAMEGVERLVSTEGYPKIIIFDDETEFRPLWKLIKSNTNDQVTLLNYKQGKIPTAIVRLGGTLTASVGEIPDGGPDPRFVPDSSPVMVFFNYRRGVGPDKAVPESERIASPIGNIGDLKSWIRQSKETERFILSILLVGFLSLTIAFLEWRESS